MKTILVQSINNKLFRNLALSGDNNHRTIFTSINKNIYEIFYRSKFTHAILPSSCITAIGDNSVIQFAIEFANSVKIIIVEDDNGLNQSFIEAYKKLFTFLVRSKDNYAGCSFVELPQTIINSYLYLNQNNIIKQNYISCFLDNIEILPFDLLPHLYPNSSIKLRLFNNSNIQHIQNLGHINEQDKAFILKESEFYLDLNGLYKTEAILSGCKILNISSLSTMTPEKTEMPNYSTYQQLLQELVA